MIKLSIQKPKAMSR